MHRRSQEWGSKKDVLGAPDGQSGTVVVLQAAGNRGELRTFSQHPGVVVSLFEFYVENSWKEDLGNAFISRKYLQ